MNNYAMSVKTRLSRQSVARLRSVYWGVYQPLANFAFILTAKIPALLGVRRAVARLEFGCGPRLTPGFTGVDIRAFPGVKFLCQAWQIGRFVRPGSVQAISSRHFFEHLTFAQAARTLKVWSLLLKPGGVIELEVPDLAYHIAQFKNSARWHEKSEVGAVTELEHALAGFWGWQTDGMTEIWDVHKSGYDAELLEKTLASHGFIGIKRIATQPWNLRMQCEKN